MKKYLVLATIALALVVTSCSIGEAPKEEVKCDSAKVECIKKDSVPCDTPKTAVVTPTSTEVKK